MPKNTTIPRIERQLQDSLSTVITERIKARKLTDRLSAYPAAEEGRADITLKDHKGNPLFFIELKDPRASDGKTAANADVYKRESKRAAKLKLSSFSICNFVEAIFYDLANGDEAQLQRGRAFQEEELDRLRVKYHLTDALTAKLGIVADWHIDCALSMLGEKTVEKTPLDEAFIYKIQRFIEVRAWDVRDNLWQQFQTDRAFKRSLELYARQQEWQIPTMEFEMMDYAHIALLMLVSKLMVYKAFVDFKQWKVPPLAEPPQDGTPQAYYSYLWDSFDQLKEITGDFELLFGERDDVINRIPFLADSSTEFVLDILGLEERYNFANLPYDIVGRIFEGLIREDERHKRGQYFTSSRIVDIINAFCIRTGNESVLDPSCGSGTFLVRAYQRKKEATHKPHKDVLNEVTGIDISGYATHLAMLNLAMRDLSLQCYPRIIQRDFFQVGWQKTLTVRDLGGKDKRIAFENFDAIVGNPPYTRQEDIDAFDPKAKTKILNTIKQDWKLEPPANTSIYAHFFYHAGKMLKNQGYLGFIVQNSWLDTRYGETLQQWICEHFRIIAIIDTKVERFFTSAEVNTNIVILQREENRTLREQHTTKFVYLNKTIAELYEHLSTNTNSRTTPDEAIRNGIESCTEDYADEYWSIRCVRQSELTATKDAPSLPWSSYLRAPDIYWRIMARGTDKWQPLSTIADVLRGYTTGANEFFFVRDITLTMEKEDFGVIRNSKRFTSVREIINAGLRVVRTEAPELWLIEEKYLAPAIKSPQELSEYSIDEADITRRLLLCHDDKPTVKKTAPYLWKYLKSGEESGIHERPTCAVRGEAWWNLGEREKPDMSFNYMIHEMGKTYRGAVYTGDNLQTLKILNAKMTSSIWYYLNSSWSWLMQNVIVRTNFGGGVAKIQGYELAALPVIIPKTHKIPPLREVQSLFEELGAFSSPEITLSKVSPARLELDCAVLAAIGFAEEEQDEVLLDLYRAVIDLVSSRLAKAHSVDSEKKHKRSVATTVLVEEVEQRLKEANITIERTLVFSKYLSSIVETITPIVKEQSNVTKAFWQKYFKEKYSYQALLDEQQLGFFTES